MLAFRTVTYCTENEETPELKIADTLPTNAFSFWGPPKMDPKIVATLRRAFEAASKSPEFIDIMEAKNAIEVRYVPGNEILDELKEIDRTWGKRLETVKGK